MGKESRLIKNTLILLIGVIGTRLISFIMLPFYTEWLSLDEYGAIDIFTTIVAMCVPILTLQLEQAVFRYLIDDKTIEEKMVTISTGTMGMFVGLVCINIIGIAVFLKINQNLYLLYLLAIDLQCCYVMIQQVVRGQGKNRIYTENSILLALINVLFSIVLIRCLRLGTVGYVLAFCVSHLLAIIYMLVRAKVYCLIKITHVRLSKMKCLLSYSAPMIINNVSWWILNASDRLVLNYFVGIEANGIYAAAGKLPGLVTTIYTVFQMAWQESAAREQGNDLDEFYSNIFRKLYAVLSYFVIGMLLGGRILFDILIDGKFELAYYHMPILTNALLFLCISQFFGGIYVGVKNSKELGWTSALAACLNLMINLLLVRKFKIYAASISTLVAYIVLCIVRGVSIKKICTITYNFKELFLTSILLFVAFVLAYIASRGIQLCVFLIITVVYYGTYKDVFWEFLALLRKRMKNSARA